MHVVRLLIFFVVFNAIFQHPSTEAKTIWDKLKHLFTASSLPSSTTSCNNASKNIQDAQERTQPSGIADVHFNQIQKRIFKRDLLARHAKHANDDQPLEFCDDNELMLFLAEIQVTNPESIINLSTEGELPIVCKQISEALTEIENYLKTCTLPDGKDLYLRLIKGVAQFVDVMCEKESETKKGFMSSFSCLKQLHSDFENCYGPADWTEAIKKHDICCAYKQIADCYFTKAAEVCGKHAARSMKKVVVTIIDAVIPVHCTILMEPCVADAAPDTSAAILLNPNSNILNIIMILIQVIITKYNLIPN